MASNAPDLSGAIDTAAQQPQQASVDNLMVQARPINDLIAADRYGHAVAAAKLPARGLRFTKIIGPRQCPIDANDVSNGGGFGFGAFG